jgi:NAD(P)-dependent dehydrogenase (short-subunit alcohol dehydrogenase family)
LHGRSQQRIDSAMRDIQEAVPGANLASVKADFASLADVRSMAGELHQICDRIDVLINNAGVFQQTYQKTVDGNELTFQVHLGTWLYLSCTHLAVSCLQVLLILLHFHVSIMPATCNQPLALHLREFFTLIGCRLGERACSLFAYVDAVGSGGAFRMRENRHSVVNQPGEVIL